MYRFVKNGHKWLGIELPDRELWHNAQERENFDEFIACGEVVAYAYNLDTFMHELSLDEDDVEIIS